MADVLDIDNAEEFEVDEEGDRKYPSCGGGGCGVTGIEYFPILALYP
jgi:hypothetical protein